MTSHNHDPLIMIFDLVEKVRQQAVSGTNTAACNLTININGLSIDVLIWHDVLAKL